ncbi:MAG: nucleotide exchange factor GrpE [Clostridiaceae bacterium]|nr:nucleotide exchange factor GrpE [Clostridiaceae bacterium]
MIDFEKELQKFNFLNDNYENHNGEYDGGYDDEYNHNFESNAELPNIIKDFNKVLDIISREQKKANIQLEELVISMGEEDEEEKEKANALKALEKSMDALEQEKFLIIKGLIEVLDQVENLYSISKKDKSSPWFKQISLMWQLISKILLSAGITRIYDENIMFNPLLNNIAVTEYNPQFEEGIVLEVLKSGYIYKEKILRKSEVVVNKHP